MPRTPKTSSRTDVVYESLRSDLLDGRIKPGERLKLPALSERFGLSMTVVREALTRLTEQGMVAISPQRGFSAIELSIADLKDLSYVRIQLETLTLRASIERGSVAWESGIVAALHALNRTTNVHEDGTFNAEWFGCHRAFHHALLAGCGSPRLLALADAERDRAELYRAWTRSLAHHVERNVRAEHETIAERTLAHDADGAAEALTAHIQKTTDLLLAYAEEITG
jgi:DNA-binding GntR family transcriptional regulator